MMRALLLIITAALVGCRPSETPAVPDFAGTWGHQRVFGIEEVCGETLPGGSLRGTIDIDLEGLRLTAEPTVRAASFTIRDGAGRGVFRAVPIGAGGVFGQARRRGSDWIGTIRAATAQLGSEGPRAVTCGSRQLA